MHCHKIYVWYKFPLLTQPLTAEGRIGSPLGPRGRHNHLSHFITAEVISHNTEREVEGEGRSARPSVQRVRGFIWSLCRRLRPADLRYRGKGGGGLDGS